MMYGTLYIVATPIGNLKDITLRAIEVLKEVDLIAAEDTRHSLKLLNHLGIKKSMTSYFEHNKEYKGNFVIEKLKQGLSVALISDAGTPVISDPGAELVRDAVNENIPVVTVPGPCAAVSAVTLSGFMNGRFTFIGFLPAKKNERDKELAKLKNRSETLVFYEAPHKLLKTLVSIKEIFGERNISVSRELTKKFEETLRFSVSEAIEHFEQNSPVGEFVIAVDGSGGTDEENVCGLNSLSIKEHVEFYLDKGLNKKEAVKSCALDRGVPKRDVYNEFIKYFDKK